jgi:exodeoxyribonuclease V alpha subunit
MFSAPPPFITIDEIKKCGQFSDFDITFARFIYDLSDNKSQELFWATLLLSYYCTSEGHVCLDLENITALFPAEIPRDASLTLSPADTLIDILKSCSVVGNPADFRPLILEGQLLYLHKYWNYEASIAQKLTSLAKDTIPMPDPAHFLRLLDNYFPQNESQINRQRVAAYCAATKRLCIITGGPGTGKTTTVVYILSLLLELEKNKRPAIALAAPTGKAAARMNEAMQKAMPGLNNMGRIIDPLSLPASTIHRLLGVNQHSRTFIHGPENPLPADIVVVDEASMIDLSLLAKFLSALPDHCRLILVGDRDQLASVEAGAVFGDICNPEYLQLFSSSFHEQTKHYLSFGTSSAGNMKENTPPLSDCIVELTKTHRFTGALAQSSLAVKNSDAQAAFTIMTRPASPDVSFKDITSAKLIAGAIRQDIIRQWREYLSSDAIEQMYASFNNFRILCALRSGPFGVEGINRLVETILSQEGLLSPDQKWYNKRPVMIIRNDYQMNLYNGDTGIIAPDPESGDALKAWFPAPAKESRKAFRSIAVSRLPEHETAFAITVHKSQGTEFDSIMLLLPDTDTPLLTRELIYTAMTRARKKITILGKPDIFKNGVLRKIQRKSGLREKLWGKKEF